MSKEFLPIKIKVKSGPKEGEILDGYLWLEEPDENEMNFYSEESPDAQYILPYADGKNWVELDENGNEVDYGDDNTTYSLSPKGCLLCAFEELGLVSSIALDCGEREGKNFENCFKLLEKRLDEAGYITDKNGETHYTKETESPKSIFLRTVNAYYPNSNDDQREAVWEVFSEHLERQGCGGKMKDND